MDYNEEEYEKYYAKECWCCYTNGNIRLNRSVGNVCQYCFDIQYKKYTHGRKECTIYNIYKIYQPFERIVNYNSNCILCDKYTFCYLCVNICYDCKGTLKTDKDVKM